MSAQSTSTDRASRSLAPQPRRGAAATRVQFHDLHPAPADMRADVHHGAAMAERLGRDALLIELGNGSSLKIRVLLARINRELDAGFAPEQVWTDAGSGRAPLFSVHCLVSRG